MLRDGPCHKHGPFSTRFIPLPLRRARRYCLLMLSEWSDRPPPRPRKPFLASGEFWLGVASTLVGLGLLVGFADRIFG